MPNPFDRKLPAIGTRRVRSKDKFDFEETLSSGGRFDEQTTTVIKSDPSRIRWLQLAVVSIFVIIVLRTGYLQIVHGEYYRDQSDRNAIRTEVVPANRGVIYDRNRLVMAQNQPSFDLVVSPNSLPRDNETQDEIAKSISTMIEKTPEELRQFFAELDVRKMDEVILVESVPREQALVLEPEVAKWPGINVAKNPIREYIEGTLLSHVIGYTGRITEEELAQEDFEHESYRLTDRLGKTGLEATYEADLRGQPGEKLVEVDALEKVNRVLDSREAIDGRNIVLTIDLELQRKVTEALQSSMDSAHVKEGAVVAINPQNGEVLALVSLPAFDANEFARGIDSEQFKKLAEDPAKPLFNRTVGGAYAPGSTFKPFVAAAALQEGVVTPDTTINSTGKVTAGNRDFYDYRPGGHGYTDIYKAIAESVNSYFYRVAGGLDEIQRPLGANNIHKYANDFGFNAITGIDMPGEIAGTIPNPEWKEQVKNEQWFLGDTLNISIGQGDVTVTPLQLAAATAAIANGGKLYRPYLVQERVDGDTKEVETTTAEVIREGFVAGGHIDVVRDAMRQTVLSGSGRALNSLGVPIYGKTGTAQIYGKEDTHAWFIAFGPDQPEIALSVLVVEGGEGHEAAVPVAKEILDWYFSNKPAP